MQLTKSMTYLIEAEEHRAAEVAYGPQWPRNRGGFGTGNDWV